MVTFGPDSPPPSAALAGQVRSLFPPPVCGAIADPSEPPAGLHASEAGHVRRAVPSRQREFALGRHCARAALAQLGFDNPTIPVGEDRAPIWPAGIVGSITHCAGFIGAVVAPASLVRGLGFDAEPATPLSQDLVDLVCAPGEAGHIGTLRLLAGVDWPKMIFSAKEAVHKCMAPLHGVMLDFRDVEVFLNPDTGAFSTVLAPGRTADSLDLDPIVGRFAVHEGLVFASAYVRAKDALR